jgi:hypothetical protein
MKPYKCGKVAMITNESMPRVECLDHDCCKGPKRNTIKEAEDEWNILMGGEESIRNPIQMVVADDMIKVLCDDGTLWGFCITRWERYVPIPGTEADR